jgi:hypothetical protein
VRTEVGISHSERRFRALVPASTGLLATGQIRQNRIVASTFFEGLADQLTSLRLYIFIARIAALFVSGQAAKRDLFGAGES